MTVINKEMVESMKQTRDELKLKTHLMKMDAQDEWEKMEHKYTKLKSNMESASESFSEMSEKFVEANKLALGELKTGYDNIVSSFK